MISKLILNKGKTADLEYHELKTHQVYRIVGLPSGSNTRFVNGYAFTSFQKLRIGSDDEKVMTSMYCIDVHGQGEIRSPISMSGYRFKPVKIELEIRELE